MSGFTVYFTIRPMSTLHPYWLGILTLFFLSNNNIQNMCIYFVCKLKVKAMRT